ncbi:MAG: hypothetical protein KME43_16445 [Myxacorys chilensis ATA2-1-KO14]|jgi:hypothetical protein|nr:hypothetical protein [Myxacorys chilensis ATA2-1-KO14]
MNVKVIIEVSIPPEEKDFDSLRMAAFRLTNNPRSITVQTTQAGDSLAEPLRDRISLITNFTVRTTAQYKVVDNIADEFEYQNFDLKGYQDMSISFSK